MNSQNGSGTELSRLQLQLATWRQSQSGRPRLPEPSWAAAAQLARRHGVSRVAQTLRLDYYRLKRRSNPASPRAQASPAAAGAFVELKLPAPAASSAGLGTIELSDGANRRLHLETGLNPSAWIALAETFWKILPMIQITSQMRILLAVQAVDFRKGIDGLAALCRQVQANGQLGALVCRSLIRRGHRARQIALPPPRLTPVSNAIRRRRGSELAPLDTTPLVGSLAALAWSSAPLQLNRRDEFVGAAKREYRHNLHRLAYNYNSRYLIVPWLRVPHLASHLLSRIARRLSADWQELYQHPIYVLESFVDIERFQGTCYRAVNWRCLGRSKARGTKSKPGAPDTSVKELWVFPLAKRLCEKPLAR